MNEREIRAANRLLAIFEGHPHDDGGVFLGGNDYWQWDELRYHKQWDWLMPVVDKISELNTVFEVNISMDNVYHKTEITYICEISPNHNNTFHTIYEMSDTRIMAVFQAVCKFIVWYNEIQK